MRMNSSFTEAELIITSSYCAIIHAILAECKGLSINKILPFAYLIRNTPNDSDMIYDKRSIKDCVLKSLSLLGGHFNEYQKDIMRILQAIDILINANRIKCVNDSLYLVEKPKTNYRINPYFKVSINESKQMSERQFLREVIRNV